MRLHRLEITAFGPYAGTEVIDMDALTASGLFLLEGPTGAGKSTVLDAVTFALYGTTASSSTSDDRLHSDFADPRTTPSVELELSIGGERLRVRRTPAHERPKLRGEGTTTEPTSVHLERLEGSTWTSVSSNKAEVGAWLTERIGLSADQFTQVVLLPQGEFAAFLKADDDTRRSLLTTIFGTRLYDRVTRDLEAGRAAAAREREAAAARIGQALAAAAEAAGLDGEEARALVDLAATDRPGELEALDARLRTRREDAELDLARAEAALVAAVGAHEVAERARRLHAELADARDSLERHLGGADEHRRAVDALRRAHAAAPVAVLLDQLGEADEDERAARVELERVGVVPDDADDADVPDVGRHLGRARDLDADAAALAHLVDLEGRIDHLRADVARARDERARAASTLDVLRERAESLPGQLVAAEEALASATSVASGLASAESEERMLAEQLAAAEELAALLPRLEAAQVAARTADDERRERVDEHQAVLQRHLDGIAARLALELVDGQPCPVCGSPEHPSPAPSGEATATSAEVEDAEARRRDAEEHARALDAEASRLAVAHAGLAARAGADGVDVLRTSLAAARGRAAEMRAAAASLPALRDDVAALRDHQAGVGDDVAAAAVVVAQVDERAGAAEAALAEAERRLAEARGDHPTVAACQSALRREAARHRTAAEALGRLRDARERSAGLLRRADDASRSHGLDGVDDARAARRTPAEVADLEAAVAAWTGREAALRGAVDDVRFAALDPAQAAGAEERARETARVRAEAEAARNAAVETVVAARRRCEAFAERRRDVARAEAAQERVHTATAAVVRLAGLAKGTSDSRMSLTTYVLRRWFDQVVRAANLRLATMSSGRYELERVDEVEKGERRAGLSLRVVDRHTGEARSPKSLSGGETFYTSLALALGLADVVRAEAGGVELDTLFIDEGFGTLDPDTLEQVMSVVDELRNGGRVVGIVSHVADLKEQVAERLEIRRRPDGSSTTRVVA